MTAADLDSGHLHPRRCGAPVHPLEDIRFITGVLGVPSRAGLLDPCAHCLQIYRARPHQVAVRMPRSASARGVALDRAHGEAAAAKMAISAIEKIFGIYRQAPATADDQGIAPDTSMES